MKKIIFFDADGTLWYPKQTKYSDTPWWIYYHPEGKKIDPLKHLMLMPHVERTLKRLKKEGFTLVLISQLPYTKKVSLHKLERMTKHFGIRRFFDEIRPSYSSIKRGHPDPKDIAILDVLKRMKIPKSKALMVGDSYTNDYIPGKKAGIECVLIGSFKHTKDDVRYRRVRRKIPNLSGIFDYLNVM